MRLGLELGQELVRLGETPPDRRQKGPTVTFELEQYSIDSRSQLVQHLLLRCEGQRFEWRQQRNFQVRGLELVCSQRWKPGIPERRGATVGLEVFEQGTVGEHRPDAAPQLVAESQRHEAGPGLEQPVGSWQRHSRQTEVFRQRRSRNGQKQSALFGVADLGHAHDSSVYENEP